jgi:hypothetical protein
MYGVYVAHNNTHEVYTNQFGDWLKMKHSFQIVRDPSGSLKLDRDEWSCVGPQ